MSERISLKSFIVWQLTYYEPPNENRSISVNSIYVFLFFLSFQEPDTMEFRCGWRKFRANHSFMFLIGNKFTVFFVGNYKS